MGAIKLFGTGEGENYSGLDLLPPKSGDEVKLFRVMCADEYASIAANNCFMHYEWAMEKKWFATTLDDAKEWGKWFYPNGNFITIEITVLKEALLYMFYVKFLDNIGPAYSADIALLNKIVRKVELL